MSQIHLNRELSSPTDAGVEAVPGAGLQLHGFEPFRLNESYSTFFATLHQTCLDLEADPYGDGSTRFRCYGRALLLPWSKALHWFPNTCNSDGREASEYYQGDFNPELGDKSRLFPPLPAQICNSGDLAEVIVDNFDRTVWQGFDRSAPIQVGVALMRLYVNRTYPIAKITPDCLHQDGEHYTFIHLIDRCGISGGDNTVAEVSQVGKLPVDTPAGRIRASVTLEERLESYAVHDPQVSHHVSGVVLDGAATEGWRHTLVIDFTPMSPRF